MYSFNNLKNKSKKFSGFLMPLILPAIMCFSLYAGISYVSKNAIQKETIALKNALYNGSVHYYSLTGEYPRSLQTLIENYHITYDTEKFIVEYIFNGSNLFPSIDVILRHQTPKEGFW